MNCRSCDQQVSEKYCGHCGTPVALKRVDKHYIVHEIQHVLHFEKGILYTIKALLLHPGKSIKTFLSDDRSRLVKPVIFLIVTSLIYTTIAHFFHVENGHPATGQVIHSAVFTILAWIEGHFGYASIIMGFFIGWWLKVLWRKSAYNSFEILIMLCFVMGTGTLIFSLTTLIEGLTGISMLVIGGTITFTYCLYAIGQFLDGKKIGSYLAAFAAYLLGVLSFTLAVIILGVLIDILKRVI